MKTLRRTKLVPVGKDRYATVDAADYELVSQYRWFNKKGYAYRRIGCTGGQFMHVLLMGFTSVDHRNHDRLDNRRANLRHATNRQNQRNQKPRGGTSQYKGVIWRADRGKWLAYIYLEEGKKYLGYFEDELDAAAAYDKMALANFGKFASLNLSS